MQTVTAGDIKNIAGECAASGKKWHFHILTPECRLNRSKNFALILENGSDGISFACYSDTPYMDIGKQLVQLLHGSDVIMKQDMTLGPPSANVAKLLERAKQMNDQGKFWHHHMLFPYCIFNTHTNKWAIVFEDKERDQIIESVSDEEPTTDLKHIEASFYSQKKP